MRDKRLQELAQEFNTPLSDAELDEIEQFEREWTAASYSNLLTLLD